MNRVEILGQALGNAPCLTKEDAESSDVLTDRSSKRNNIKGDLQNNGAIFYNNH